VTRGPALGRGDSVGVAEGCTWTSFSGTQTDGSLTSDERGELGTGKSGTGKSGTGELAADRGVDLGVATAGWVVDAVRWT
jgi:hypothetical protein